MNHNPSQTAARYAARAVEALAPNVTGLGGIGHPLIGPAVVVGGLVTASATYFITTTVDGEKGAKKDNEYEDLGYTGLFGVLGAAATFAVLYHMGTPSSVADGGEPVDKDVSNMYWVQDNEGFVSMLKNGAQVEAVYIDPLDRDALRLRCAWIGKVPNLDRDVHRTVLLIKENGVMRQWIDGKHVLMISDKNNKGDVTGILNAVCGAYVTPVHWGTVQALDYLFGPMCPLSPPLAAEIKHCIGTARPQVASEWDVLSRGVQFFIATSCLIWAPQEENSTFKLELVAGNDDFALGQIQHQRVHYYMPGEWDRYWFIAPAAADPFAYWGLSRQNKEYLRNHWGVKGPVATTILFDDSEELKTSLRELLDRIQLVHARMQPAESGETSELAEVLSRTGVTNVNGLRKVVENEDQKGAVEFVRLNPNGLQEVAAVIGFESIIRISEKIDEKLETNKCMFSQIPGLNIRADVLYILVLIFTRDPKYAADMFTKYTDCPHMFRASALAQLEQSSDDTKDTLVVNGSTTRSGITIPLQGDKSVENPVFGMLADMSSIEIQVIVMTPAITYTQTHQWSVPESCGLFHPELRTIILSHKVFEQVAAVQYTHTNGTLTMTVKKRRWLLATLWNTFKDFSTAVFTAVQSKVETTARMKALVSDSIISESTNQEPNGQATILVKNVSPKLAEDIALAVSQIHAHYDQ
jgi:hypothetical protein